MSAVAFRVTPNAAIVHGLSGHALGMLYAMLFACLTIPHRKASAR